VTEDEAKAFLTEGLNVSRETFERLDAFAKLVIAENEAQNLISAATIPNIWARHIVDSAQLALFAPQKGVWLDLGSGAGFPGIIIALIRDEPMILVESRRKRVDFLQRCLEWLSLSHVRLYGGPLENMPTENVDIISARAFAPLPKLLRLAHRFSNDRTTWILPKGKSAKEELALAQKTWQGVLDMKASYTEAGAHIIVASAIRPMRKK